MVTGVQALVRRAARSELRITFRLEADLARIRVPAPDAPRINTELWRHTCFETFIALDGQPAYHEFNFAPSGQWALYEFRSYRDGGPVLDDTMRPRISVRSTDDRLELDALVRIERLSAAHARATLRIGLSAVIESSEGVSYWAMRHPGGKPDFHNAGGFALRLEPVETAGSPRAPSR
jgi:hypothetical protein